jgi:F0F1-type ATP synthase assembly protein I
MAERVGFEPTYTLLGRNSISSRARYDLFGTSPGQKGTKVDGFPINYFARAEGSLEGASSKYQNRARGCETMAERSVYAKMGRLSAIIVILPSSMASGGLLGYFVLDRYLGIFPWGTILMTLLGAGAGFYQIVRLLTHDDHDNPRPEEN